MLILFLRVNLFQMSKYIFNFIFIMVNTSYLSFLLHFPKTEALLFYCVTISSQSNQERKINSIQIGKEEVKLSPFANYLILYTENPKDPQKIFELEKKISEGARYQINIRKSVALTKKMYKKEIRVCGRRRGWYDLREQH